MLGAHSVVLLRLTCPLDAASAACLGTDGSSRCCVATVAFQTDSWGATMHTAAQLPHNVRRPHMLLPAEAVHQVLSLLTNGFGANYWQISDFVPASEHAPACSWG